MLGKTRLQILGDVGENADPRHIATSPKMGVEKDENMYY